jgi:hypothetical protein
VNLINRYFHFTHREIDNALKWVATFVTLAGAILTSLAVDPYNVYLLNAGAFIFLIWAVRIKDSAMVAVNAGLLTIYAVGTIRALLVT